MQSKIIEILSNTDPIQRIETNKDKYFSFIDRYMVGCEHKNFHCEGDVWEHTKLVIQNMVMQEHDWIDILAALLHDVGKKEALTRNSGKNMHAHEIYSEQIASEWLTDMEFDTQIRETILWLIRNHTLALELKVMKKRGRIHELVHHPLFGRLTRLARADCFGTLDENGNPRDDFDNILKRPIVAEIILQGE